MVERHRFALTVLGAAVFCAPSAMAAHPHSQAAPEPAGPLLTQAAPGGDVGAYAEERMKAGDCAGALDAFDQALRKDVVPELQRDRGTCHDQLGHPFPAIDDYRAYLEARPDAPDAEAIRVRLTALESQTGIVKPVDHSKGDASASASANSGASLDTIETNEELDLEADHSSLRRGHGFALAVHFDATHFGTSGFGWAEGAGFDLRYSVSRISTLIVGMQFMDASSDGTASSLSGPGFIAGYEARLALDARVNNAILLGATFGYESLSQSATGLTFGIIEPKGRLGFRHVFGPTFGLEGSLDCGPAWMHLSNAPAGVSASTSTSLIGGHIGVVLGF